MNITMVMAKGITDPHNFEHHSAVGHVREFPLRAAPVADGEIEDGSEDRHGEENGDGDQKEREVVHVACHAGRLNRK
ncbi:MAG: hypothetical protein WDO73_27140 [Ignavibacteriota bacterium]